MYEAQITASIQNLFWIVFRKANPMELDASDFFLAIQDPNKWDNNGFISLKHQICWGMTVAEDQLETAMESEANQLTSSKYLVSEKFNFMTNDFQNGN